MQSLWEKLHRCASVVVLEKSRRFGVMKIITILGTRPEITKLSPVLPLLDEAFDHKVIHTGQHYDYKMDEIFFEELQLRKPDYMLHVGSGSHAEMTAKMLIEIEKILVAEKPDWVIVFADPNTPLAGALAAVKLHIPVIHMEAGCRSFNKKMPEEINRIVCDHCADLLLAPDEVARGNLLREGLPEEKIEVVGSTALEAALRNVVIAREKSKILEELGLVDGKYALLTIHRAENTDNAEVLCGLVGAMNKIAEKIPIVFPMHPRFVKALQREGLQLSEKIHAIEAVGYVDMLMLLDNALFVMTGSGGLQEEAAALDTPCLVIRNETEWTYLTDAGKNLLVSNDGGKIVNVVTDLLDHPEKLTNMKNVQLTLNTDVSRNVVDAIKRNCSTKDA